jgi:pilus assembly protein CpaB
MRVVTIILIVVALAIAGATAFFVSQFLASTEEAAQKPPEIIEEPKVEVLVSADDLPLGKIIQSEDLRWQLWPEDSIQPDYITRGAGGDSEIDQDILDDIRGSAVRVAMIPGEPIIASKLFHRGESGFLSGVLAPGMRAVTVGVNAETSGGGFVLPGDRVDLVVIFDVLDTDEVTGETTNRVVSETVLQDLRVLAVDQEVATETRRGEDGQASNDTLTEVAETVTLEVTPNEAQIVAVADQMGRLRLVLRSALEGELSETPVRYSPDYVVSHFLARRVPESARVLVARRDLEPGIVLTDRDWVWEEFAAEEIEDGWLPEGSVDVNILRSALTDAAFNAGEPLVLERLILPGQDSYITSILSPNMRAITIRLDESRAVSAFIAPGDMVDVLYQFEIVDTAEEPVKDPRRFTETLLENIRVLHIDRLFSGEAGLPEMDGNRPTATLEVTPEQAELLTVAASEGQLTLILRGESPGEETRMADYTTDFEASRALVDLLYGLTLPGPPESLSQVYLPDTAPADDTVDFLDLEDYLDDLGESSNGTALDLGGDSASGRDDGQVRVYRATEPQDLDFSQ